ncbi:DUF2793 domain-containing protein [Pararhizobium mangrovi]|uniref:DUF2793 domain-containing protein n=1 Tax=Pararhizobium mangrovi TaxID=2590452 RepID=A0A506UDA0_9HYPH|nr:DUF2793 domain-containing protein [Pararhizobium mangrovi]TPW30639.1 DUF2793 domain-containing protein [Pararhizobium mangrovi]
METTPSLALPYLMPSQAQKHVTHNEALRMLDALVQLRVVEASRTAPPEAGSVDDGARYIVGEDATGAWAGHEKAVAAWQDGAWSFYTARKGWLAWVEAQSTFVVYDGEAWIEAGIGGSDTLPMLGINTAADETNRLAVRSAASLLTHEEGGHASGDHRLSVNKKASEDTASLVFQTGYSGRAEFGIAGSDDWQVKVSPDGAAWKSALVAEAATGRVGFPNGLKHVPSGAPLSGLIFTPGGDGEVSIYRNDAVRNENSRTVTIVAIADATITLDAGKAALFFDDDRMNGVSRVRVWNMSRTPYASAWIEAAPTDKTLRATSAADLSGWSAGDTLQIGDPKDIAPRRGISVDIAPMMQRTFGATFRQSGLLLKTGIAGVDTRAGIAVSPTAESGSFLETWSFDSGALNTGTVLVPCTSPSPISNTNLIFVREDESGPLTLSVTLISVVAVIP